MSSLAWRLSGPLARRFTAGLPPPTHDVEIRRGVRVRMRDGVELAGDLYLPTGRLAGAGPEPEGAAYPTFLLRSPYGRSLMVAAMWVRPFAERGHPVFIQSVRGGFGSGGRFTPQVHDQADGEDTLRWVRSQGWFTGKLVTTGPSYLGYVQWAAASRLAETEPEVAPDAMALQVTMADFGAVTWDHGAFALRNALGWTRMMARIERPVARLGMLLPDHRLRRAFDRVPLRDGDLAATGEHVPWYQDWLGHEDLADPYWTGQSHTAAVANITAPVTMLTGWYDIFLPWQLRNYADLVAAGNPPELTVGPWGHVSREMGARLPADVLGFVRRRLLADPDAPARAHPVEVYVTGAQEWRGYDSWPPAGVSRRHWFLRAGGELGEAPAATSAPTRYGYDPSNPTPSLGGPGLEEGFLPVDNAEHEKRDDVVTFTTPGLVEPLEVTGEPVVTLFLATDRPTTDVFARICDVHPDGRSMTVCDGIRRIGGRGTAATDPEPDGDGVREIEVSLWPTGHRFRAGHRLRVQLSSGAHPRYARNLGDEARTADARTPHVARQQIFHDPSRPSRLTLPILPAS
jgi:putative CocE/NonD family hydrolase